MPNTCCARCTAPQWPQRGSTRQVNDASSSLHAALLTMLHLAGTPARAHPPPPYTHIYQDNAASDSLEPAIQLIHLNRVMRQAVRLIRGVQLGIEQEQLRFSVFSAIPWFKVRAPGRAGVRGSRETVCTQAAVGMLLARGKGKSVLGGHRAWRRRECCNDCCKACMRRP